MTYTIFLEVAHRPGGGKWQWQARGAPCGRKAGEAEPVGQRKRAPDALQAGRLLAVVRHLRWCIAVHTVRQICRRNLQCPTGLGSTSHQGLTIGPALRCYIALQTLRHRCRTQST